MIYEIFAVEKKEKVLGRIRGGEPDYHFYPLETNKVDLGIF